MCILENNPGKPGDERCGSPPPANQIFFLRRPTSLEIHCTEYLVLKINQNTTTIAPTKTLNIYGRSEVESGVCGSALNHADYLMREIFLVYLTQPKAGLFSSRILILEVSVIDNKEGSTQQSRVCYRTQ